MNNPSIIALLKMTVTSDASSVLLKFSRLIGIVNSKIAKPKRIIKGLMSDIV